MMPPAVIYRSILIPHSTEKGKTTTMRVEEDLCAKCVNKTQFVYARSVESEEEIISTLGLTLPEINKYEY